MKKRFTGMGWILLAAGGLLLAISLFQLIRTPVLLEYAVCAPASIDSIWESREKAMDQLGDAVHQMSCEGLQTKVSFSAGGKSAQGALHSVDLGYLETCPRPMAAGRWMDGGEVERGDKLAVLDRELAFALFGSEEALGKSVSIGGGEYRVIGIAEHGGGVGDVEPYGAYVPLRAAAAQGLQPGIMIMYALPAASEGMDQSFIAAMESLWGEGSFYNTRKEVIGASMLPRLLFFVLGMMALARLLGLLRQLMARFNDQVRRMHSRMYLPRLLPRAAWRYGLAALFAAALLAAVYLLFSFMIEPVYTFTEWVPESLVDPAAISTVFWNLTRAAARSVTVRTPDAAAIAFWGGFANWGAILVLLACAMRRRVEKKRPAADA